jgi:sugar phosphate isomerase/epimerase
MWMGADPLVIAATLGDAIYHVHAKDARIEPNAATRTVLETMPLFTDTPGERAWNYVTLGDGHDESFWRRFCAALAEADYDDVLSIEHEDTTIDPVDGVRRTVDLLRRVNPLTVT